MTRRRLAPWAALCATVVCVAAAALLVGVEGLWGALIGGVIVMVFLGSTPAVLGPVAKATPTLSLLFAMIFFVTKVVALLALFVVLRRSAGDSGAIDPESVSAAAVGTTLVWVVARVIDTMRDRIPVYDVTDPGIGEREDPPHRE